jgi:hypothetical protein
MNVSLSVTLTPGVEQPSTLGGRYHDYVLVIVGWPDELSVQNIPIATRLRGGSFRLLEWKIEPYQGKDAVHVNLEVSLLGHDLDQWAVYDLKTGQRLDVNPKG